MPLPAQLIDVPTSQLGTVVQSFTRDGATSISCQKTGNDTWTVTAR